MRKSSRRVAAMKLFYQAAMEITQKTDFCQFLDKLPEQKVKEEKEEITWNIQSRRK